MATKTESPLLFVDTWSPASCRKAFENMNGTDLFEAAQKYANTFCDFMPPDTDSVARMKCFEMFKIHFLFPLQTGDQRSVLVRLAINRQAIKLGINPDERAKTDVERAFVQSSDDVRDILPTVLDIQREILEKHYLSNPLSED